MLVQPEDLLINLDILIVEVGFLIPLKKIPVNIMIPLKFFGRQELVALLENQFLKT